ncbi:MAG: KEOPS complex kinase/ATPase Bud32 [Candidatus Nanoarchaeia archaeon]|nr:KEOPS complex kinase/ATPase Bud32 [Candidatus Nanoarchaeia archaeon]
MEKIGAGAEAVICLEKNTVIKKRIKKSYRIKEIDERLRKFRTRRETKILEKLSSINFPTPTLILSDDKDMIIKMNFLDGKKIRDVLNNENCETICNEIGKKIAILHNNDIIHGDLTTSNMILIKEVYFIDFGLSFFSDKIEDKAVDLHLLRQAIESKHHGIFEKAFNSVLNGYKIKNKNYNETIKRLEKVELRGKYKGKSP